MALREVAGPRQLPVPPHRGPRLPFHRVRAAAAAACRFAQDRRAVPLLLAPRRTVKILLRRYLALALLALLDAVTKIIVAPFPALAPRLLVVFGQLANHSLHLP